MPTIKIDEREYDMDKMSAEAKAQFTSIQFVEAELERLNAQIAVLKTAQAAYVKALKELLDANQKLN